MWQYITKSNTFNYGMIDKVTLNLYECCKCAYQWINWDGINKTEGPMSIACPKCKNVRWNQKYTENEISVVEQLARQHVIKDIAEFLGSYLVEFDFIAYDFLYEIRPQPDMFELKQALAISDIEQRHEFMLSIILDRIRNKDTFEKKYFAKYSKYDRHRDKMVDGRKFDSGNKDDGRRKKIYSPVRSLKGRRSLVIEGCKHTDDDKIYTEIRNALYDEDGVPKSDMAWPRPYAKKNLLYWDYSLKFRKEALQKKEYN